MGIEPTSRVRRLTGFEDQGSHQTPFTSTCAMRLHIGQFRTLSRKTAQRSLERISSG